MIEFLEETHTYLVDGVITPSVTQIVNWATNTYKDVPQEILDRAAKYGTGVHDLIERYERGEEIVFTPDMEDERRALSEWQMISDLNDIEVLNMEVMVAYETACAGRYDILAMVNGKKTLIDIKTTSEYHQRNLEIQEGLYLLGLKEEIDCACVWLPKNKPGKYIKVDPIDIEERLLLLQRYKDGLEPPEEDKGLIPIENVCTPAEYTNMINLQRIKKAAEAAEKKLKEAADKYMTENGTTSITFKGPEGDFVITKSQGYYSDIADVEKMKEDGIFEDYKKQKYTKGSIKLKWVKKEEEQPTLIGEPDTQS